MRYDCGIACHRIADWLNDELRLPREGVDWVFSTDGASCRVSASPLESRSLGGGIQIERTLLSAQGDQSALDVFERLFTLRFVSAGG